MVLHAVATHERNEHNGYANETLYATCASIPIDTSITLMISLNSALYLHDRGHASRI